MGSQQKVQLSITHIIRWLTSPPHLQPHPTPLHSPTTEATFAYFDAAGEIKQVTTEELCKGKKVVLFAVPGAFTPTCSLKHLPGFVEKAAEIKSKGVDTIACVSVNGGCNPFPPPLSLAA